MAGNFDIGPRIGIAGEAEFKSAINGVNKELKALDAEMKDVTSQFDKNEKSAESLAAKNEVLGKAIENQQKKSALLSDQYEKQNSKLQELGAALAEAKDRFGENSTEAERAQQQYNKQADTLTELGAAIHATNANLNDMQRAVGENEQAMTNLNKEAEKKALDAYAEQAKKLGENAKKAVDTGLKIATAAVAALSAAAVAAVVGIVDLAKGTGEYVDGLITMSNQTGISTTKLQEYEYAMRFIDVEVSVLTGSMAKLIKNMSNAQKGTGATADAFRKLGVSVKDDVTGNLRDSQTVFNEAIAALGEIESETERDAIAMQLFGKSAQALNPLIKAGADELANLSQEAHDLGLVLDDDAVESLGEFDDIMQVVDAQTQNLGRQIALSLIGPMKNAGNTTSTAIAQITKSLQSGTLKAAADKLAKAADELIGKAADAADKWIPKLVDGIVWLVDNGDDLVSGLLAITGGLAALKAGLAITDTIRAVQEGWAVYTGVQKAAALATDAAAVAHTGLNAAIAANPVGAFIILLAALVTGIGIYIAATSDAEGATRDFAKEAKEAAEAADASREAHENAVQSLEDEADSIETLTDKVVALSKKENKTASDKQRLLGYVEELNRKVPELSLAYDEQTDSLNKTTTSIRKMAEAQAKAAMQEQNVQRLIDLYKQQDEQTRLLEESQAAYNEAMAEYNERGAAAAYNIQALGAGGDVLLANTNSLLESQVMLTVELTRTNVEMAMLETSINSEAAALDNAATATDGANASQQELNDTMEATPEQIKAAEEAYNRYAEHTQNMFDRIKESGKQSVESLTKNLQKNQEAIAEWSENLATLAARGVDEGLLEKLREAGPEAAGTVRNLVKASDEELTKLSDTFKKGAEIATEAAKTELTDPEFISSGSDAIDEIAKKTDANKKLEESMRVKAIDAFNAMRDQITKQHFPSLGEQIAQGVIDGVTSKGSAAERAMRSLVESMLKAGQNAAEVSSPSKLFKRELGVYMGQGTVEGMREAIQKSEGALRQVMQQVTNNAVSNNSTTNNNIGGVNITVQGNADSYTAGRIGQKSMLGVQQALRWRGAL